MPLAVTLRLDDAAAAPIAAMWRALAEGGVDDDCLRLGYPPHITLAVWPDEAPVGLLAAAVGRFGAEWDALPVALAGFGVFPGAPAVVWAVPVATETLLARQTALVAAVTGAPCHEHYRPGRWVPHVTLGQTDAPGRALEVLASLWRGRCRAASTNSMSFVFTPSPCSGACRSAKRTCDESIRVRAPFPAVAPSGAGIRRTAKRRAASVPPPPSVRAATGERSMDSDRLAVSAAVDDAAWRIVALQLAAGELPPGDSQRNRLLDEAAALRRQLKTLALFSPTSARHPR